MNDVGKRIEELRKKKGLSRPAFCDDESGLSVRQLARIEKGEFHPTLKTLEHIAEKLEIPAYILMPDYQELSERYKEIKYFLLHHPDYGDKELQEQKDEYFDEIFEDFYDNLPRDEQIMVDCLQAIDQVRAGQNSLYGQGVLENNSDNLVDIELFQTSTLLKLRLYFLCALMDGLNSGFIKETTQEEIILLFKKLCLQIEETELEDLYLLRDALFAALCCLEIVGEFSYFKMAVDKLNHIMNRTRDFQKKPLILMVEWKYYIQCDFNEANRKYQEAKMVAQIFGNEELITSLDREWQKDIKKYIQ
ncbi:helix-turn-helix domain-containing protein [Streptococcus cristatus]|uniref:Transcriptional regulator n=1 Tax=Streptococcus cristatus TaxID=45634 RepID=A0A139MXP1_STRCR|nr:XRE family transcriptional regulator [Streptococcus cristatus]KXT68294.1 Transcriptional regulator [Streptococcus cristatus]